MTGYCSPPPMRRKYSTEVLAQIRKGQGKGTQGKAGATFIPLPMTEWLSATVFRPTVPSLPEVPPLTHSGVVWVAVGTLRGDKTVQ